MFGLCSGEIWPVCMQLADSSEACSHLARRGGTVRRAGSCDDRCAIDVLAGQVMREAVLRLRYRLWPDHVLGEILSKRWTETAIPVIVLLLVAIAFTQAIPGFLSP